MVDQSLKDKTVKGTFWSAADTFIGHGVSFLVGLVLARLLSPDEYGLIGIITIFTTILVGFIECGFSNALIRKREVSNEDYNTMFIVNMVMSLFSYAILFFGAPLIARFFDRPQLVSLARVTGLILIIQSFAIVQSTILSRNIDFKTKTKAIIVAASLSGAVGIGMAFAGCGVWSLVGQQLTLKTVYSMGLWIMNRWRPHWGFNKNSFRYMWGFGWKLMLSGFLSNLWNQLYQAVVGKFYSPATLGQYTRSREYASIFSTNLTAIVQRVSYPVLSKTQDNLSRMLYGYRRIIKITMFVTATTMLSMGAVAEPLIFCLIGPQWHEAATFLPLICITLSLYPLHAINLNMLQVQGRSDIYLYIEIIKKVLAIGPICLGIFVNIYWMLVGTIITGIIAFFLNTYYTGKKLGYSSWMQIKDIAPSYGLACVIAISVYFLKYLPLSYWLVLPLQIIIGSGVFFLICETLKMPEYFEVKSIVMDYLNKIVKRKKQNYE